jgi:hypothetical protein
MKRVFCNAVALAALSFVTVPAVWAPAAAEAPPLVRLAEIGPWSAISGLIGYRGRLWFVNSVKYVNHNSADLYSYDPRAGDTRYEAHMFSQDAGDPVVEGGVLYWPFEDSRWSVGRGEYMATDGKRWHWGVLPERLTFHIHAMGASGGALYAATSAWRASLQRSDDGGSTWKVVYDHPTPEGKVSRITGLTDFGGRLHAGLVTWYGAGGNLRRLEGGALVPVPGWPVGRAVIALTPWRGHLYAANNDGKGRAVWRTDGARSERVTALDGHFVRDIAAGPKALWAITVAGGGGGLWRSTDGLAWTRVQMFAGARPADIAVFGGRVYVGAIGAGKDGSPNLGSLWGPPAPALIDTAGRDGAAPPGALPGRPPPLAPDEEAKHLARLDAFLADGDSYPGHGRDMLRALHLLAPRGGRRVGDYLSRRLEGPFPERDLAMFGGNLKLSARTMARWYLLWGLAMTGQGKVAPALLATPVTAPINGAEKYLEPAPAAAWAVARLGQNDRATLAALIARLGRAEDPQWLEGDIVGALTALTGERFGYDHAAWRRWWRARNRR